VASLQHVENARRLKYSKIKGIVSLKIPFVFSTENQGKKRNKKPLVRSVGEGFEKG
jgi:hypothetical protein